MNWWPRYRYEIGRSFDLRRGLGVNRRTWRTDRALVRIFLFQKVEQLPRDSPAPLAGREGVIGYLGQQFVND
jgi:hypothetical protein